MSPASVAAGLMVLASLACFRVASISVGRHRALVRVTGLDQGDGLAGGAQPRGWTALVSALPSPPPWLTAALGAADVPIAPEVAWSGWLTAATMAALAGLVLGGALLAVLALAAVAVAPAIALRSQRGRANTSVDQSLPQALEAMARSLRCGATLRQAVAESARETRGPLSLELAQVATQADHGRPLVESLEDLSRRRPVPGVSLAVAALCLGIETGGAQARAIDGVAVTLRDRLAVAAELRALSSQARISALVIGVAPIGFGAFAATTDSGTADFLLHTPGGIAILATGLTLDGLGWLWMQRLARVQA